MDREIIVCLTPSVFDRTTVERAMQKAASEKSELRIILVIGWIEWLFSKLFPGRIMKTLQYLQRQAIPVQMCGKYRLLSEIEKLNPTNIEAIYLDRRLCIPLNPLSSEQFIKILQKHFPDLHVQPFLTDKTASLYEAGNTAPTRVLENTAIVISVVTLTTFLGLLLTAFGASEGVIMPLYILVILICSLITGSWQYTTLSVFLSVLVFNFFFADPRFSLHSLSPELPYRLLTLALTAILASALSMRLKKESQQAQYLSNQQRVLLETNQALQKAESIKDVETITLEQINLLLGFQSVIFSRLDNGTFSRTFISQHGRNLTAYLTEKDRRILFEIWKQPDIEPIQDEESRFVFIPVATHNQIYAVLGVFSGYQDISPAQKSIMEAILSESALAMENIQNARKARAVMLSLQEEKNRSHLLRALSHDLRTPITSILGHASNLARNEELFDAQTRKKSYQEIVENSNWLISLVENLLSASLFENGEMALKMHEDILEDLIDEVVEKARKDFPEREIILDHHDDLYLTRIDSKLIRQALNNLIENAIIHTPENSQIKVETDREDGNIIVSISDTGQGISAQDVSHIFDMFYTGSGKADSNRRIGLGLFLCNEIIKAHNGKLWYEPNFPNGSRFVFTLPESALPV